MTKEEFIKIASLYRPHFKFTLHTEETLDDPETLKTKISEFIKETQGLNPDQYNERQLYGHFTHWKYEEWDHWWQKHLAKASKETGRQNPSLPEIVHFRLGTSLTRAEAFLREGQGYVRTEDIMGTPDWNPYDRWLGLQVTLTEGPRSEIDRAIFFAKQQAFNFGDTPVILEGYIPKKYLWSQKNAGEYCISRKDWKEIKENYKIIKI